VEFARISRDGSLTLVVVSGYPAEVTTLWSIGAHNNLEGAIQNLAGRECITKNFESIHGIRRDGSPIGSVDGQIASTVHDWLLEQPSLQAAIWTGLGTQPSRWRDHGYEEGFTVDNALSYLRSLQGDKNHPTFEYMRRAPRQVLTQVRRRAKDEGII
jgi:hypothetical protein